MKDFKQIIGNVIPLRRKKFNPKQRNLVKLGCAALALTLAVGTVPFLRGLASEEEAVSSSDVVSSSDAAVMTVEETVEMKPYMGILIASGSCGDNVTYTLDTDGVLTISGSGAMTSRPWGGNRDQIKKAVIETGVTNIVEDAFFYCSALTSVEIPNSVTSIGNDAFYMCSALTSVEIPNSVTSIGSDAFYMCSALTSVEIPNSVTSIGSYAFYRCSALTSVNMPGGVISIGNYAFYNCSALTSVTIPDSVTNLGKMMFTYCTGLTSVTLPKNLSVIPYAAFAQCTSLAEITIGYVTEVGNHAFDANPLTTVNYPCDHDISGIQSSFPNNPEFVPKHTWEWVTDTEPTCGESGAKHEECTVCHVTQSEGTVIDPTGEHTWEWVTDTEPTCGESGAKHEECTVCHATQSEGTVIDPTGNHTWEWVTDTEPTCGESGAKHEECTVCHATQSEGTVIDPTGNHTWEWVTDTEPTETDPGEKHEECTVCHAKQNEHTEIPARGADDYVFTADSAFTWTKDSSDGLKMVVKNTSNPADDPATFEKLVAVYVDGEKLTRDTDYTAQAGSIEITLSAAYLEGLSTGEHTLKIELTVTTVEHTFTVAAPAASDTPATGESGMAVAVSIALMLLAAYGGVYAVSRRRRIGTVQ